MSKFKQGLKFRNVNTTETDIMVVTVDGETPDSTLLTVFYLIRISGRPLHRQQITIKSQHYNDWKLVVENPNE